MTMNSAHATLVVVFAVGLVPINVGAQTAPDSIEKVVSRGRTWWWPMKPVRR